MIANYDNNDSNKKETCGLQIIKNNSVFFSHLNVCLHHKTYAKYNLQYVTNRHFMVKLEVINIYFDFSSATVYSNFFFQWFVWKVWRFNNDSIFFFLLFEIGIFLLIYSSILVCACSTYRCIHDTIIYISCLVKSFSTRCQLQFTPDVWCKKIHHSNTNVHKSSSLILNL